jgi:hypothetical protein
MENANGVRIIACKWGDVKVQVKISDGVAALEVVRLSRAGQGRESIEFDPKDLQDLIEAIELAQARLVLLGYLQLPSATKPSVRHLDTEIVQLVAARLNSAKPPVSSRLKLLPPATTPIE